MVAQQEQPPTSTNKNDTITFAVTENFKSRVEEAATRDGRTLSAFVRRIVERAIEQSEQPEPAASR